MTPTEDQWIIEVVVDGKDQADQAYTAIEQLLSDMGKIGILSFWRRTTDNIIENKLNFDDEQAAIISDCLLIPIKEVKQSSTEELFTDLSLLIKALTTKVP